LPTGFFANLLKPCDEPQSGFSVHILGVIDQAEQQFARNRAGDGTWKISNIRTPKRPSP
jgi:hypothetical protein